MLPNSPERRLLFRADGNATIGLGHIMRLLALADILRGLAPCTFLVREPSTAVSQLLVAADWECRSLSADRSLLAEADWLANQFLQPTDVLVLDGYDFTAAYQQRLRRSGCGLVAVDDLRAWPVIADVLLNHSPGVAPIDYDAPPTVRLLLGPAFSLVRQPFLAAAGPPQPLARPTSALICFGGADPLRFTERTLTALFELSVFQRIGLIVGGAFGSTQRLEQLADRQPGRAVAIYRSVDAATLVGLLQAHAVAVVPASTVLIEALIVGRPVITGYYADNQRGLADYVHTHQQAFSMGNFADLASNTLVAALRQGLHFHELCTRQPYVDHLRPDVVRAEVQQLLNR